MFKSLKNWIFDRPAEDHATAGLAFWGIAGLAVAGASICPISLLPTFLTIGKGAVMLSALEVTLTSSHLIADGIDWLFKKIFKRKNKSSSQKIAPSKTQSHSNSNDKDHSDMHAQDNVLLQRKENDSNGQSVETPIMQPPIIPAKTANTQSLQSPGNQSTLLLQEINQLKNEVSQLRNRIRSLENDKRNLIKQNSELQEKISPSKNVTDFLGKRAENRTNGSLVPSNPTKGKMSTATAMALSGKSSETASH